MAVGLQGAGEAAPSAWGAFKAFVKTLVVTELADGDADEAELLSNTVRVFRVEGYPNCRITVLADGTVKISGNTTLFLNFGDKQRALEFFEKRVSQGMDGVAIKSFEVPYAFLEYLRSVAVPEQLVREFPNAPIVVDIMKAVDQYGLRSEHIDMLIQIIIQGSGQIE